VPAGGWRALAITPDGKTVCVVSGRMVTLVSTATGTAGTPIPVTDGPIAVAITPNSTTAYVASNGNGFVTPISTVTGRAGKVIRLVHYLHHPSAILVTPDGKRCT
jgi:DNA-binding beta-propeller fold protein YncE